VTIVLPWMPSPNYSRGRVRPIQALVMHSVESPIKAGIARSLAGPNWFGSTIAGTSANAIFDQTGGIEMVKPADRAWHVGGGNAYTYGTEHAGRAAFTAADWLTADGKKMLAASAAWNRQVAAAHGIPWVRLSTAELHAGKRGLTTHNDCRLVWGGTSHTDPQWANEVWDFYLAAGAGGGSTVATPPATGKDDDVALSDSDWTKLTQLVRDEVKRGLGNDWAGADPRKVQHAGPPSTRAMVKVWDGDDTRPGLGAAYQHIIASSSALQDFLRQQGGAK
jgi:hypothetical protein